MSERKAIIIGASSGIGKELAKELSRRGYTLGLAARREELLAELCGELAPPAYIRRMDVSQPVSARQVLQELLAEMGDVELVVINAGISKHKASWEEEQQTIDTNVAGFVALARVAMDYFTRRGAGHLVGISSVAGLRGFGISAAYCASKAFISMYMQALRQKSTRLGLNIAVTDIRPGFIDTPLISGRKYPFWVVSAETAARQIYTAIRKRKRLAYVPRRWRPVAWLLKALPDWLFIRLPV